MSAKKEDLPTGVEGGKKGGSTSYSSGRGTTGTGEKPKQGGGQDRKKGARRKKKMSVVKRAQTKKKVALRRGGRDEPTSMGKGTLKKSRGNVRRRAISSQKKGYVGVTSKGAAEICRKNVLVKKKKSRPASKKRNRPGGTSREARKDSDDDSYGQKNPN